MKTILKTSVIGIGLVLMFVLDVPPEVPLQIQILPKAHAIFGVRRRAWRRGVLFGASMADMNNAAAATNQQAAASPPAAAAKPAEAAKPAAAPPPPSTASHAATDKPLPLGTVVNSLPAGCTSTPVGGVDYFYCSGNFYRAAFHSNNLVYVTAKP